MPISSGIFAAIPCIPRRLQVMDELGLIDGFLKLPHQQLQKMDGMFGGTSVRIADLSRLKVKYPFIAFMPQWDFLNFLRESGKRFASLKVMMNAEATDLIWSGDTRRRREGRRRRKGRSRSSADLTIGCDGRHSMVRERAGLEVEEIGAPMDVLWFRAGRRPNENRKPVRAARARQDDGDVRSRRLLAMRLCDRQGAIRRGEGEGADAFRDDVARMAPILKSGMADVKSWDDVKLLTVAINRLKRWTRPGLLCIGDAAHAMSPVGGVGVNLAVQDAVATANLLAAKLVERLPVGG